MSWESPINLITNYTDEIVKNLQAAQEECVMRAVANVGVYVEKDELLKALAYDRNQYTIGWHDGYNDRDKEIIVELPIPLTKREKKLICGYKGEIVRCKDCKWFNDLGCAIRIIDESDKPREDDFCSFGERREE